MNNNQRIVRQSRAALPRFRHSGHDTHALPRRVHALLGLVPSEGLAAGAAEVVPAVE